MPDDARSLSPERIKHLEFIQNVITRLGNSSFLIKGWALTIAAAFFAVTAGKLNWKISLTALVPVLAFWFLDGYFLWQERLFRCLYDDVRQPDSNVETLSMDPRPYRSQVGWVSTTFSATLLAFYGALVLVDCAFIIGGAVRQ